MQNKTAEVDWLDGQPISRQFGDVYFSRGSGLDETRHVFLRHNALEQRWRALNSGHFTIAETGFGTGLNFLCAWDLWLKTAPAHARLHFVSCEKYPLTRADMQTALQAWPALAEQSQALMQCYRHLSAGMHRWEFEHGRIVLTLMIGDAIEMFEQLEATVDAWFLDGFAPAKNPDMWQSSLFTAMAQLSHKHTTFATFTSAGIVKRGLTDAGFTVSKVAGFGSKREMLCGQFNLQSSAPIIDSSTPATQAAGKAIVVGGGIAGCSSSAALARRGWQVTLIERHAALAQEASGNPAAMLYPRLAMKKTAMSQFSLSGFLHTNVLIDRIGLDAKSFDRCGMLQLAFDAREASRQSAIAQLGLPDEILAAISAEEATAISGIPMAQAGLHFPTAGWVDPSTLCHTLSQHTNIRIKFGSEAIHISRSASHWQVWDAETLIDEAPVLILACGNQASSFAPTAHLPLQPVRGQISIAPATTVSRQLRTILCADGYISPAIADHHCLGATFSPDDTDTDIRAKDHAQNMHMLSNISATLAQQFSENMLQGRAALRVATPDYLPLLGGVVDTQALQANPIKAGSHRGKLPYLHGLYINTGHGSKGMTQAPLCAEILASAICREPLPLERHVLTALDPNRFLLRNSGLKHLIQGLTVTASVPATKPASL